MAPRTQRGIIRRNCRVSSGHWSFCSLFEVSRPFSLAFLFRFPKCLKKTPVAWYMVEDAGLEKKQLELHLDPPKYVSLDDLKRLTRVLYWKIDVDRVEEEGLLAKIREHRGYTYEDMVEVSRETLPDFDAKTTSFYTEHFHADEEIRLVLAGRGYFDVRDRDDHWIRILVTKGDLIVLPSGLHHRFTLDHENYAKVKRYFVGEPVWTAINRPCDEHEARKKYVESLSKAYEE